METLKESDGIVKRTGRGVEELVVMAQDRRRRRRFVRESTSARGPGITQRIDEPRGITSSHAILQAKNSKKADYLTSFLQSRKVMSSREKQKQRNQTAMAFITIKVIR